MTDKAPEPPLRLNAYAFFFDLDGTLAEIQPTPEQVVVPPEVCNTLHTLFTGNDGALALISGRPIAELDALVAPLILPAAGIHGAERREISGQRHETRLPAAIVGPLQEALTAALAALPGCRLENKGASFALHYRQAPNYKPEVTALAKSLCERYPQLTLQTGKCVVELKPRGANKGAAINTFMESSPFAGRTPLFIGDDTTDEAGFRQVNALGGISVKVGPGPSEARYRLANVAAVHLWLTQQQAMYENNISLVRS